MLELLVVVMLGAAPAGPKPFDSRIDEAQRLRTRECTAFTKQAKADAGYRRAIAAFAEAAQVSKRAGSTALAVCAKFGGDYSPLCEPCLINPETAER